MSHDLRTTRRAMLAGTSTFTFAIPAIASTSTIVGPDAELLALGAQIDQILPTLLEINRLGIQSNRAMEKHACGTCCARTSRCSLKSYALV